MSKRVVAVGSALAIAGATLGTVGLAVGAGGGPKMPAVSAAPPAPPVSVVNHTPNSRATADYWTSARLAAARPLTPKRDAPGVTSQSYGSANLDFARSRITPKTANTAAPYNGVGKLYFTIPGQGDFQCTASIIGKRLIVTAGHCMYGAGGFYTNWEFIPGFNGSAATLAKQRPYGSWTWSRAIVPGGYAADQRVVNDYDFGIIQLADQTFGTTLKTVFKEVGTKFATATGHLFDTDVTMLGYPCNFDSCNIMQRVDSSDHRGSGVAAGTNGDTAYEYGSDMTGGSSGGPWVENFGDPTSAAPQGGFSVRNTVVGVTSYGYTDPSVLIEGASQFNSSFSSIQTTACGWQTGNC